MYYYYKGFNKKKDINKRLYFMEIIENHWS